MCGIVGYIGPKEACPILINGLKRLEYRGYDSAGVALLHEGEIDVYKCKGRVVDLERHLEAHDTRANVGMGHTRWATHGEPNDTNAHPHVSMNGLFAIVHNGIIENHALLKEKLQARGYSFRSETDTEVLANLIEYIYLKGKIDAEMAVRLALTKVVGAYGLVIMCKNEPDKLIVARKGRGHPQARRDDTQNRQEHPRLAQHPPGGHRHQQNREGRIPPLHAERDIRAGELHI